MSPSELDTKAPSVPPHPFKVGDRVRRVLNGILRSFEVMKLSDMWKNDIFIRDLDTGEKLWCSAESVQFDPGANEVKVPPNAVFKSADEQIKDLGALAKHLPLEDTVNHPNHYTASTLETIDAIEAMVGQAGWSPATGYRLGNVLKYLWRHAHKGGLESLKKARWYLDREIAAVEKAQEKKP